METAVQPLVLKPRELARRLGVSVKQFGELVREGGYEFFRLSPGGAPGERGRDRWGMTEVQFQALLRGQSAYCRQAEGQGGVARVGTTPVSPDGKSRLKRRGR